MLYSGLTKKEYIGLLKECGMCTKKWTRARLVQFHKKKKEIIDMKTIEKKKKLFGKGNLKAA